MFRVSEIKNNNYDYIEIEHKDKGAYLKIFLNQGASVQELKLDGSHVIQSMAPLTYKETYASAIMFPFANRVKDGKYNFEGKSYQLSLNEKELNNALHGLIYDKTFRVESKEIDSDSAKIKLSYVASDCELGFPFSFYFGLEYHLSKSSLKIIVHVENLGVNAFPFTLGWHPYFMSENLSESSLIFESNKKIEMDDRNITTGIQVIDEINELITDKTDLDDCFILNSEEIKFLTPKYLMTLRSSEKDSFLQVYTPPFKNAIAIEPTTGVSDSYNNEIGLRVLNPSENYHIHWDIHVKNFYK